MRYLLLAFTALIACRPAKQEKPINLVCERVAKLEAKLEAKHRSTCTPEYTNAGEHLTHSALVSAEEKEGTTHVVCVITDVALTLDCRPPLAQQRQPRPGAGSGAGSAVTPPAATPQQPGQPVPPQP